ncbi:MAG: copper resistance protein CopC [Armatimonadetes bacterium]|nr:copper resistance protein CopC [Armatimonadota bacterium]
MRTRAILLFFLIAMVTPRVASAHAAFVRSDPRAGSVVTGVNSVHAWFREELDPRRSRLDVLDAAGRRVTGGRGTVDLQDMSRKSMRTGIVAFAPGRYTVVWEAWSAEDGHREAGRFSFVVRR